MEMQKYRSFDIKMKVLPRLSIGENVDGIIDENQSSGQKQGIDGYGKS